ncbi:hypothetical protein HJG44_18155 [Enterovirga sp. DB1703]|uniref:DUF2134 domain-containing protein n=1 Tax=Enterovirga aerilata TaxID=2730920 RepID=A0A849IDJ4_9HYPH|nr:hypothetical protein [Enterovirga sp. DB1703]
MSLAVLAFASAGVLDVGFWFVSKRQQQAVTDLAAIAAASDLANPRSAATATLAQNGFRASELDGLELGHYQASPATPLGNRFVPGATPFNAARVSVRRPLASLIGSVMANPAASLPRNQAVRTEAIAAQARFAGFGIGSGLARLDAGLLNAMLGSLLGSELRLSLLDYESLLSAKIDLFRFLDLLAVRVDLKEATYADLLSRRWRIGDLLRSVSDAAQAAASDARALAALSQIALAKAGSTENISLEQLFSVGPFGSRRTGSADLAGNVVGALDLVTQALQIAQGGREVRWSLPLKIPGLVSADIRLAVGEQPAGRSSLAVGATGTSVHTAQTRLLVDLQLLGMGSLATVRLPIYVELAPAQAELTEMSCSATDPQRDEIRLKVTPGLTDAWIGEVGTAEFGNAAIKPSPGPATLVGIPLLRIKGQAHARIGDLSPQTVVFSRVDVERGTRKTTGTGDLAAALVKSLLGDLRLKTEVLGLGLPLGIEGLVVDILAARTGVIDQALSSALSLVGLKIGVADTWATTIRCSSAVLVR